MFFGEKLLLNNDNNNNLVYFIYLFSSQHAIQLNINNYYEMPVARGQ